MPIDRMVSDTIGYTPVAVKFVINEATIHAHFDGRQAINYWDFTKAREMHDHGLSQPIRGMSYEDRRRLAYHEAGHAYAAVKLLRKWRLSKVTIIRHGDALGFASWRPEEEVHPGLQSKDDHLNRIQISLASRAAEEIFLGTKMDGVGGDLRSATGLASYMIGAWGMDDSFFSYGAFGGISADGEMKMRVEKLLDEQFSRVKTLLDNNKEAVIAIAEALILRNELTDIDVDEILARVEAEYPFVDTRQANQRPFGFMRARALPDPSVGARRNGYRNGNGKRPEHQPKPARIPVAQQPGEPAGPSTEPAGEEPGDAAGPDRG